MEVSCSTCNRTFIIDDKRGEKARVAKCLCGARLRLITDKNLRPGTGPQRLGKYILQQRIAVGGMGEIYYGKMAGVEGFEREVAIKKMLPHLSEDRAFVEMMIKEAKLTVLLHHPNIVQVYDLSREGNEYYIAMEYVPGVTIGHLLELSHRANRHLPYQVAVHLCMQVLRGLAYAHDLRGPDGEPMNLLHRDITPQNILVTRNAWVKITDFGIAKARNEISTTSPGMIKGKLGYIAPEQLAGQNPDQRVDIFCVGILLWETLATRRLFKGVDEIDTFRLISEAKVPPLSEFRDDVPVEIEKAMRGGLTRLPDNRYASADAFYDALNQAIFPSTADDFAAISKRFFEEHGEFFESVDKIARDTETVEGVTTAIDVPPKDEKLLEITSLVGAPAASKSNGPILAVIAFIAALVLGLGGFVVARMLSTDAPGQNPGIEVKPPTVAPLTQQEIQMALDGEESRFLDCYRQAGPTFRKLESLKAQLTIASTGGVAELSLIPALTEFAKLQDCLNDALRKLQFRAHPAPSFTATVNLPAPEKAPATTKPPVVENREPLTPADIQKTLQQNSGAILKCLSGLQGQAGAPSVVNATLTISTAGKVTEVGFEPTLSNGAVNQCLYRTFKAFRFSKKPKADMTVKIPLKIQTI